MKKLLAIAAAALLAFSPTASSAEDLKSDYFQPGGAQMPPKFNQVIFWADSVNNGVIFGTDPRLPSLSKRNREQIESGFKTVLGMCEVSNKVGCIEAIEYKVGDEWLKPKQLESPGQRDIAFGGIAENQTWDMAYTSTYEADEAKGYFRSVQPNLFSFEKAPHRLGDNYWVNAVLTSRVSGSKTVIQGLDVSVWATKIDPNCNRDGNMSHVQTATSGYCNYLVNLPTNLSIKVSINLGNRISELSGWFDGRIHNPEIDFGVSKAGVVTIAGSPIEVSAAITNLIPKGDPLYSVSPEAEKMQNEDGTNGIVVSRFDGYENWTKFGSKVKDQAMATNTYWRLSSWDDQVRGRYGCSAAKGVLGVVLSNAIAYTPGAPNYDRANSTLKFQVAAPHLKADGSQNVGFYDLLIKESVAKCLWGNDMAANKAEISVTNADGSAQVATTTFAVSNGWAKFKAYGFHYSNPAIAVKLTKLVLKKTTIKCVKGKLTKKVTATAPKCPTGYKKK